MVNLTRSKNMVVVAILIGASILLHTKNANSLRADTKQALTTLNNSASDQRRKGPLYRPDEIIIKLKEKEAPDILFTQKYSQRKKAHTALLSNLQRKYPLTNEKPVFKLLHAQLEAQGMSIQQLETANSATLSKRQRLAPKSSTRIDLLPLYIVKTTQKDIIAACKELSKDPDIAYAEPNYIYTVQMYPNDPYYASRGSWQQEFDDLWGLKPDKLNAEAAWDISQGDGAIVAVIDTGVDYTHPDITARMWSNSAAQCGYDFVNDDADPMDGHGHGTHCAGTIAGTGNNNLGIIGVAPKAKIMALKGLDDRGQGTLADLSNCVYYAVNNGADILSCSWGGQGQSELLTETFHYAYNANVVCIAAAGNDNVDTSKFTPASIDTVIAVAATDY